MNERLKCGLMTASYYSLNCLIFSYAVLLLGDYGFTDQSVGILIMAAGVIGCVLQLVSGRLADRSRRWYWKPLLILFGVCILIISALRLLRIEAAWWNAVTYGALILLTLLMMPFINSTAFFYTARGVKVNFGIIRGIGSVVFAAVSWLTGALAARLGSQILVILTVIIAAVFLLTVFLLPGRNRYPEPADIPAASEDQKQSSRAGFRSLFKRYPSFFIMTFAIAMVFVFHNIINSFLLRILEPVGGNSESLGIALAIAAVAEVPILFLYSRIAGMKKMTTVRIIIISCAFFTLRGVLYIFAGNVYLIYAAQVLQSVSFGLATGAKATYADECMDESDKATGQAAMSMTDSFGMVMGNLLGGVLLTQGGVHVMLVCGTAIALGGTILAAFTGMRKKGLSH